MSDPEVHAAADDLVEEIMRAALDHAQAEAIGHGIHLDPIALAGVELGISTGITACMRVAAGARHPARRPVTDG